MGLFFRASILERMSGHSSLRALLAVVRPAMPAPVVPDVVGLAPYPHGHASAGCHGLGLLSVPWQRSGRHPHCTQRATSSEFLPELLVIPFHPNAPNKPALKLSY